MTTMTYEFGDQVRGLVADEHDWGSAGPRIARPRREVTGTVVGLYSAAPTVVQVETADRERLCIRVTGRVAPSLACPACSAAGYSLTRGCHSCGISLHGIGHPDHFGESAAQ